MNAELVQEWSAAEDRIFSLLEELNVLDILRDYVPARQQYLVDRLSVDLRLKESLESELGVGFVEHACAASYGFD